MTARALDVAASPYDATAWGLAPIPVETPAGRAEYALQQEALMAKVAPVREGLRQAYEAFLAQAFGPVRLEAARQAGPDAERFAQATPGGAPWRRNLVDPV